MKRSVLVALVMAACTGRQGPAARTAADFADALDRGDHGRAYGLMTSGYRQRVSQEAFASEAARVGAPERAALRHSASHPVDGLVLEGGAWRFDRLPGPALDQTHPRAALRSFLAAVEARRWDYLLELMPSEVRDRTTVDQLAEAWTNADRAGPLLRDLALGLDAPVDEQGDRATLVVASGKEGVRVVRFLRERGAWTVEAME